MKYWGMKWQGSFTKKKTQLMVIERSESDIQVNFNRNTIRPQQEIEILGTIFDKKLTFNSHIESLTRRASQKLASFRRISWLLDDKENEVFTRLKFDRHWNTHVFPGEEQTPHTSVFSTKYKKERRGSSKIGHQTSH